jgi:tetratricopeptide (TPR) repeat protein
MTALSLDEAFERGRKAAADGDLAAAHNIAADLIERHATCAEGHCIAGVLARYRGELETAQQAFERALQRNAEHAATHLELARLHLQLHQLDLSLDHASHLLYVEPDNAAALQVMASAYEAQNEHDQAAACLRRVLELEPDCVEALCDLGYVYQKQGRTQDAIKLFERALEIAPDNTNAQHQLGYVLGKCEQYARSVELFSRCCERTPPSAFIPRQNLANAYFHLGRSDLALPLYEQMLAQEPFHFDSRWNRSHVRLAEHDFENGWSDYEFRTLSENTWPPRLFPFRPWKGEPLAGKTLLVIAEQGMGDQIMFSSCLPELIARAGRVLVEVNHRVAALFRNSFPQITVLPGKNETRPPWLGELGAVDYQVYMGSLPGLLRRRIEDFPAHRGYVRADPVRTAFWRERVDALGPGLKVGLSWRGGTAATRTSMRSLDLERLLPILRVPGCRFVSLQYGKCGQEVADFSARQGIPIAHWEEAVWDYGEGSALCSALDLTISVCTSVIHLNGALGRPVWILVPKVAEWRYGTRGERMPWYPSARLFRQHEIDAWEPVIARVAAELSDLVGGKR